MNADRAIAFDNFANKATAEECDHYIDAIMSRLAQKDITREDRELWLEDLERWIMFYRMKIV